MKIRRPLRLPARAGRLAKLVALALVVFGASFLASAEARAGDEFERGFKIELGRIAAHEAVHGGRYILSSILLGHPSHHRHYEHYRGHSYYGGHHYYAPHATYRESHHHHEGCGHRFRGHRYSDGHSRHHRVRHHRDRHHY